MILANRLQIQTEDQERLNNLLREAGDIIARSNTSGLELDFDHWCTQIFSEVTGYGNVSDGPESDEVPEVWYTIDTRANGILDDDIGC